MLRQTLVLAALATVALAHFQPLTLPQIRANSFTSPDFVIDLASANVQARSPGRLLQFGDQSSFPALGLADVDMTMARVTLDNGAENPQHVHPRGTEALYLTRGTLQVFIAPELGNSARYENTIYAGQGSVFPKGLAHGQKCVDANGCEFVAVLNSGDPGSFGVKK